MVLAPVGERHTRHDRTSGCSVCTAAGNKRDGPDPAKPFVPSGVTQDVGFDATSRRSLAGIVSHGSIWVNVSGRWRLGAADAAIVPAGGGQSSPPRRRI